MVLKPVINEDSLSINDYALHFDAKCQRVQKTIAFSKSSHKYLKWIFFKPIWKHVNSSES